MLSPSKKYYTQTQDQEDLISIGTIGLIKGVTSYKPEKGVRLATYAARCIENEILMYFRSQKKLQGEVSLSDSIDMDQDGNSLSFMDVVSVDDTMLDDLSASETQMKLRSLVATCLTPREASIIEQRYGLNGKTPKTQREIAAGCGISRSYVSRRAYCKRRPEGSRIAKSSRHHTFSAAVPPAQKLQRKLPSAVFVSVTERSGQAVFTA